jgi:hypothetical protein
MVSKITVRPFSPVKFSAKYEGYFPYTTEFMSVIPGTVLPSIGKLHSNNIQNLINAPL